MELEFIKDPRGNIDLLKVKLETEGCVFYEELFSEEGFVEFGNNFGEVYKHRDSVSSGITKVTNTMKKKEAKSGFFGLTNSHLFPHTDRSTVETPPNILVFYCKHQDTVGGDSILIDGKKIYSILKQKLLKGPCPVLEENSVVFADNNNFYRGSIFEELPDKSISLRFRNDSFSFFKDSLHHYLNELYKELAYNQITFKLKKGQGYIINNAWFLHGRKGFSGQREMWRLLLDDNFLSQRGFTELNQVVDELDKSQVL